MSEITSTLATAPLAQVETPLLAGALAQGPALPASLAELDRAAGGGLARAIASGDFKGKRDDSLLLYPSGGKAQRILLVGVGKSGEVTRSSIRRAAAVAAKRARALGATQLAFAVAPEARNNLAAKDLGQVVVEGAGQGYERKAWPRCSPWPRAACRSRGSSCSSTGPLTGRPWHSSARASRSIRAAFRSSRHRTWKT